MSYKKILTIQDISCIGQCSLTVALPILSACGVETCILPSAVLSTHTAGFRGYTFRDLTEDMPGIMNHWRKEGIRFEAIYSGYLGSARQIEYVRDIIDTMGTRDSISIVDPAMADFGRLYPPFDAAFVEEMKSLVFQADYILPNITEAALLTGSEYREQYDEAYISDLLMKLNAQGAENIILTGVSYDPGTTGVAVFQKGVYSYYKHVLVPRTCHGTGDVFASSFVGSLMNGKDAYEAAVIAADFTVKCILNTQDDASHWYGVKFETAIPDLVKNFV